MNSSSIIFNQTQKKDVTFYEFYIFNERKKLLFYIDFINNPNFNISQSEIDKVEKEKRNRVLNVVGISTALKPFCVSFADNQLQNINYFKTTKYQYSILESQSGIKLILLTSNEEKDYNELLNKIYIGPFRDYVVNNILYENGTAVDNPFFVKSLKAEFDSFRSTLN